MNKKEKNKREKIALCIVMNQLRKEGIVSDYFYNDIGEANIW